MPYTSWAQTRNLGITSQRHLPQSYRIRFWYLYYHLESESQLLTLKLNKANIDMI